MVDDELIKKYYQDKVVYSWDKIPLDHKQYLKTRFKDSESYKESVWRILYNIEIRPVCCVCGSKIKFIGRKNNIFSKTCSNQCFKKILQKEKSEEELYYLSLSRNEKTKYTCNKKYGVDHPSQLDTNTFKKNNPQKNDDIKRKTKETRINKYGQYMAPNNIKALLNDKAKEKRKAHFNKTLLERYGDTTYRNLDKCKQTCIDKYGVSHYSKTNMFKEKINSQLDKIINKINTTKRKNNSFNISNLEDISFNLLKEKYKDVKRQYRSKLYPYLSDFYIPSLDLYIECNYHWTHGKHAYNQSDKEDNLILEKWKQKNTEFYNNAINTWTIRDVKKRETAKQNNLNYIEFWNINELKSWLNE